MHSRNQLENSTVYSGYPYIYADIVFKTTLKHAQASLHKESRVSPAHGTDPPPHPPL